MHYRTQRRVPFLLGVATVLISLGTTWGEDLLA
jgi:hypothetical protein